MPAPAFAADVDPFHVEDGHWMSLDYYKDDLKHKEKEPEKSAADQATPAIETPSLPDAGQDAASAKTAADGSPAVAAPARALDLPVMPGMNKGFDLQVNSTVDDAPQLIKVAPDADAAASFAPPEHWQNAIDFAHQNTATAAKADESESEEGANHDDVNVRLSYLPNRNIAPAPTPEAPRNHGRPPHAAAVAAAITQPEAPKKSPAEVAACAAIDAYKKHQLQAIQGDRETLKALQDAIQELGLQKQLGFMTDPNSRIVDASGGTTLSGPMNMPADASTLTH